MPRAAIEAMGAPMTTVEKVPTGKVPAEKIPTGKTPTAQIRCPFTYTNGKQCPGHVVGIRAFRADPEWQLDAAGVWRFDCIPRDTTCFARNRVGMSN